MSPTVNRPFFLGLRFLLKSVLRGILFIRGFRVVGAEHLPGFRRPAILIANHAALVDSIYFICGLRPRFTICGARPKYFERAVPRFFLRTANILKVEDRGQFVADCRRLLASGEILLIYPEMGRHPEALGPFKTWAAEVALGCGVPVIPCYLYGTTQGQRGKKRLIAGSPVESRGDPESLTLRFREAVLRLKPSGQEARR